MTFGDVRTASTIAGESGKQPETGALTTSGGSSNHALNVTTWEPSVASLEHLCDDTMTCPCRTCSQERGKRVDKAARAA